ncbi:hypothetical protein WA026_014980 [Henosepilachna vigintioctopunctata]|uniref:Angio-associated migratory cell protein n=1 Tax=Henosepilachna vigintioctopunctata TaxID=420089 RepID=A0AAW1U7X3_9CUCU
MDDENSDLELPNDLDDVEVIYSDGEEDDVEETSEIKDISKYSFEKHTKSVFSIDISRDEQFMVSGGEDDTAYVWNLNTRDVVFECTGHNDSVVEVRFNHDGQYVATADMSGMIQVWSVRDHKLIWCNEGDDLQWLQWHSQANILVSGFKSGDIYIWQVPQSNCKVLPSHGFGSGCGKILPDGKRLVSGYMDGQIKLWDIKSSSTIWQLSELCSAGITSLDINTDGTLLIVAPTSELFLLSNGKKIANLQSHSEESEEPDVEFTLISSELGVVVTGALSGELCVWDLGKHILRHQARIESSVTLLKWGKDGKVFVGATDGVIYVCDVRNGTLIKTLTGHEHAILDIVVPSSGDYIISASDDTTVKIFDV